MTSKEKYLDLIDDIRCEISCEYIHASIFYEIDEKLKELEEYFHQQTQPTLSECIKEWEALGYEVFIIENYSISFFKYFEKNKEDYEITFELKTKSYYCTNMDIEISVEMHQLITKTMKALGWL